MTEYYIEYGDGVDKHTKYPDVKTARANAVRRIYSGYNVKAIVPVKSGKKITIVSRMLAHHQYEVIAIHWNVTKKKWESHTVDWDGTYKNEV